jgi:hypothetical protein
VGHQRRYSQIAEAELQFARREGGVERYAHGSGHNRDHGDRSLCSARKDHSHPIGSAHAETPQAPNGIVRAGGECRIGQWGEFRREDGIAVGRISRMVDQKICDARKCGISGVPALRLMVRLTVQQPCLIRSILRTGLVDCTYVRLRA